MRRVGIRYINARAPGPDSEEFSKTVFCLARKCSSVLLKECPPEGTDTLMAVERQSLDENIQIAVQTPPISAGDYSACRLALLSLQHTPND